MTARPEVADPPLRSLRIVSPAPVNLNGIGQASYERLNEFTDDELARRIAFLKKQMNFLTVLAREFHKQNDMSAADALRQSKYDDSKGTALQSELNLLILYQQRFRSQ